MIELFRKLHSLIPVERSKGPKASVRSGGVPVRESENGVEKPSNMDLQDFVTTTLCQISAGVSTAKNYDRCVAPRLDVGERDLKILRTFGGADGVFLVEFDVAVTISDASENGATASIMVLSPPAPKPKTKGSIENSSVNRLKFTVPIAYR
jgi:hypothetical protein